MSDGKKVQIELTEDEHERLDERKEEFGLTWRGMLLVADRLLDEHEDIYLKTEPEDDEEESEQQQISDSPAPRRANIPNGRPSGPAEEK